MSNTEVRAHEWVGKLPDSWETMPLRALMEPRADKNVGALNQDYLSLMANVGVIPYADKGDIGNKAPEDLSKCKLVNRGDFVLNSMNFGIGSFGVSKFDGVCSSVYVVLKPKQDRGVPEFLKYIFSMRPFQKHVQSLGNGILEHRAAIGWDDLKNMHFPVPPVREQKAIADLLDRETAQIDNLISKQEQLINILIERRKSLIESVITRGLEDKSHLVATGISQFPNAPRTWVLKRLRHIAELNSGADYKDIEADDGGYPVYGSGGIFTYASKYMYDGESVLFGRKGTIDRPLYVNGAFWTVDTMYWARFAPDVHVKFVSYWAQTLPFGLFTTSTALPSMTSSDLKNFYIALPPKAEQVAIANYLDERTSEIDVLVDKTSQGVQLLRERRQALISAAVTGKIDVQG